MEQTIVNKGPKLLVLVFSVVFIACNSNRHPDAPIVKVDTLIAKKTWALQMMNHKNLVDTNKYQRLPFWDTTISHSGAQGYIDTFTIYNTQMRIIHQDTLFDGVVEVRKDGQWIRTLEFENLGNHNDYDRMQDLDGDGNKDLIFYWKWFGEIHFFDTAKKSFCDTENCTIGSDWTLLDTARHIFYEEEFGKLMHSPCYSHLFTFKRAKRIEIASLELTYDTEDGDDTFIKGTLYLEGNKRPVESILPKEKLGVMDFCYQKFWEDRYLKFSNNL